MFKTKRCKHDYKMKVNLVIGWAWTWLYKNVSLFAFIKRWRHDWGHWLNNSAGIMWALLLNEAIFSETSCGWKKHSWQSVPNGIDEEKYVTWELLDVIVVFLPMTLSDQFVGTVSLKPLIKLTHHPHPHGLVNSLPSRSQNPTKLQY